MEELIGGRDCIYKTGNKVIRPLNVWSSTIQKLLVHLHENGFTECPTFIGVEGENEILSFVEGQTYDYPLTGAVATESALISTAKLLKRFHDSSQNFLEKHKNHELHWMLPAKEPQEVICHGDLTPYNVAMMGNFVVGFFDFDVAHPAPRIWDLAFSIYSWAPFKTDPGCILGTLSDQIKRAQLFCDSYNATIEHRKQLVLFMIKRLELVVDFMNKEAAKGDKKFQKDIKDGHHLSYLKDIEYLKRNEEKITSALIEMK